MILVCTPANRTVQATFAFDLAELIRHDPECEFAISQGSILANNRNALATMALSNPRITHILFIDSDMRFPPDVSRRLEARDVDIVGANCRSRNRKNNTASKGGNFISSKDKSGPEEVDALGFGCTLIKADVFRSIEKPWFAMPFDGTKLVGEDVFFCKKARDAGFKIFVDHDVSQRVRHTADDELAVE